MPDLSPSHDVPSPLVASTRGLKALADAVTRRWGTELRGRRGVIYGAGLSGQLLSLVLHELDSTPLAIVDGNAAIQGRTFPGGVPVSAPEILGNGGPRPDYVFIASSSATATASIRERVATLVGPGVPVHALAELTGSDPAPSRPRLERAFGDAVLDGWPLASDLRWMTESAARLPLRPRFELTLAPRARRDQACVDRTLTSLRRQAYGNWIARGFGESDIQGPARAGRRHAAGPIVSATLVPGDELGPHALFEIALALNLHPGVPRIRFEAAAADREGRPVRPIAARTMEVSWPPTAGTRARRHGLSWDQGPDAADFRIARVLLTRRGRDDSGRDEPARQVRTLAPIFNRAPLRPIDPARIERVLIVKLDHLGDLVLAFPAIREVRRLLPRARISVLCGSWSRDFLAATLVADGTVDEAFTFDAFSAVSGDGLRALTDADLAELTGRLEPLDLDLAIDLRRVPDTRPVLHAIPARWKVAYGDEDVRTLVTLAGPANIPGRDHSLHIVDQLRLLLAAHLPPALGTPRGWLSRQCPARRPLDVLRLEGAVAKRPWIIGVAPGCGDALRAWPVEHFAALASALAARLDAAIVLFGSDRERPAADAIVSAVNDADRIVSRAGDLSLVDFSTAVRGCDLFIGNTTGPTHIAALSDVPTLNIFSGQVSPFEWAPIGRYAFVLRTKPACAPCYLPAGQCPHGRVCLESITPGAAADAALRILLTTYGTLRRSPRRLA